MIKQQEELVKVTTATYVMLPMLQLNKSSFGVGNFVNCYVDLNGYIVVDVKDIELVHISKNINHVNYVTDYNVDNVTRIVYSVPDEHIHDISLFQKGAYSQFSGAFKAAISKYSLLSEKDITIKALNPQKEDRQKIADDLGVKVDLVKELRSAPDTVNFIKIK